MFFRSILQPWAEALRNLGRSEELKQLALNWTCPAGASCCLISRRRTVGQRGSKPYVAINKHNTNLCVISLQGSRGHSTQMNTS